MKRKVKKIGKKPVQRSDKVALDEESSESSIDSETLDYITYLGGDPNALAQIAEAEM
jgi:hypothetical protein